MSGEVAKHGRGVMALGLQGVRNWRRLFLAAALLLPQAADLHAEAVGSPASILKKGRWVMGLGGGALLDRAMDSGAEALAYHAGHVRGYGLTDWLSVYGKIGGAYVEVDDPAIKKTLDPSTTHRFGANVLSSVQLKCRFFEHQASGWEWDGSLRYVDIRARRKGKNELRWHEWDVASSVAKSLGNLKPYLGVRYAVLSVSYRVRENGNLLQQGRYHEDTPVALFVGTDWSFGEQEGVVLNIEGLFIDGTELTAALSYTF